MDKLEILELLKQVSYKDWRFTVGEDQDRLYLQVAFDTTDNAKPSSIRHLQTGRKWMLSPYMTKSEIVQTAFKAALTAEEHETREQFRYKGEAIFGPHFDVDALRGLALMNKTDTRPEREPLQPTETTVRSKALGLFPSRYPYSELKSW